MKSLKQKTKEVILTAQKNEITEHFIYQKLSQSIKDSHNQKIIKKISRDELKHYHFWKKFTQEDVRPDKLKIWWYFLMTKFLGLTFGIKLMEAGEEEAQITYKKIAHEIPEAKSIVADEDEHEKQLINLIDEERLKYVGSVVLGLNDALVELTGTLAGLTLGLQNTKLIAMAGLITGVAASFSMATSEYLSIKSDEKGQDPFKASIYTGMAYLLTVFFLIFPYLIFSNFYFALGITIFNAVVIIYAFTFYISVAKDLDFKKRFSEMALISLGVAVLSFGIGFVIREFLNVDV